MIRGFFLLLICQLVGEVLARSLSLPAPGPVIGLALLTAGLWLWNWRRPFTDEALGDSDVGRAATGLLGSMSLMFVPAGVGVVQYLGLIGEQGVALGVSLVISTVLTLIATVGVFRLVKRALASGEGAA